MDVRELREAAKEKDKVGLLASLYQEWAGEYRAKKDGEDFLKDLEKAAQVSDRELVGELRALFKRVCPTLESLNKAAADSQPQPLIRPGKGKGSLLAAGEIALLAGAGGAGKSTIACQIALASAQGEAQSQGNGCAWKNVAGLTVRAGRVVILSYEDRRRRVWRRCQIIGKTAGLDDLELQAALDNIGIVEADGWPLFGIPEGGHIGQAPQRLDVWPHLWAKITDWQPSLVIVDPVLCAYNGEDSRVAAVRAFLDALRQELAALDAGLLLVAHSTKEARHSGSGALDPGAVSGSAAWTDAARTALLLQRPQDQKTVWELATIKANYCGPFKTDIEALDGPDGELAGFKTTTNQGGADDNWA